MDEDEDHNIGDTDPYSMDTNAQLEYMNGQYGGGGVPDPSADDSSSSYDPTDTSAEDAQNGYVDPSAGSPVQYAGGYAPQPQGAFIPQDAPDSLGKSDLLRLGLNWMAAAGKPGATALGSFGEAGSSVLKDKDASAKEFAKQQRLAYYKAQEQTIARQKLAQGLQIAQGQLAETHDYHGQEIGIRQGELGIRGQQLGISAQNADTEAQRLALDQKYKMAEIDNLNTTPEMKNYKFQTDVLHLPPETAAHNTLDKYRPDNARLADFIKVTTQDMSPNPDGSMKTAEDHVRDAAALKAKYDPDAGPSLHAPVAPALAGAPAATAIVRGPDGKSLQIPASDLQNAIGDGYTQVQ